MTKSFHYLVAGALALGLSAPAEAEEIVDAHIKATGGKPAIAKIKTIYRTGAVSVSGGFGAQAGEFEEIYDLAKGRGYSSFKLPGYHRESGWNDDSTWLSDPQQPGKKELDEQEARIVKLLSTPSPVVTIHTLFGAAALRQGDDKEFNGKQCAVLGLGGAGMEFYINRQSKLLEGFLIPGYTETTLEDYQAVNGVQMAGKMTMKIPAQDLTMIYDYRKTEANGKFDESEFSKPGSRSGKPAVGGITAKQIIDSMDKNGDGKISKDEASEDAKLFFADIDANSDGAIDLKEAEVMAKFHNEQHGAKEKPAPPQANGITAKMIVQSMDKNSDGKIGKDEASAELKPYFSQFDANRDGVIDEKEAEPIAQYVNQQQGK